MRQQYPSVTVTLQVDGETAILLAAALEAYPDAINLSAHVWRPTAWPSGKPRAGRYMTQEQYNILDDKLCDWQHPDNEPIRTVWQDHAAESQDDGFTCIEDECEFHMWLRLWYQQTGAHLENAPDEWAYWHVSERDAERPSTLRYAYQKRYVPNFGVAYGETCLTCGYNENVDSDCPRCNPPV